MIVLASAYLRKSVRGELTQKTNFSEKQNPSLAVTQSFETDKNILDLTIEEREIRIAWVKIDNVDKLHLYPNFFDKLTSEEARKAKHCEVLVSGGFYTTEGTPTGLFISEGMKIKSKVENNLFNGVFSLSFGDKIKISHDAPSAQLRIGLQSGPLLKKKSSTQLLNIKNDKTSRRMVAAITDKEELVFIAFYNKDSVFEGPYLAEVPKLLNLFEKETEINISDALNLDGGSASSFYSGSINLPELSPIGSYFCLKS